MQRLQFIIVLLLFGTLAGAQTNVLTWSFETEKVNATEYDLLFKASIKQGWYVYSEFLASDEGPVATEIIFRFVPGFEPSAPPTEQGEKHEGFDEIFGMEVTKFSKTFEINQRIALSSKSLKQIGGTIRYMVCSDEVCLPPVEEAFTFLLDGAR